MDNEKFQNVLGYFNEIGIELPTEVKNAIEDVFSENDNIESVQCYHVHEADLFEQEVNPVNDVAVNLDGSSVGSITNIWTYYGDVEYHLNENITLFDGEGNMIEEISKVGGEGSIAELADRQKFAVVLKETVIWNTKVSANVNRALVLMIYCPYADSMIDESDSEFESIYSQREA